ncbi:hypothetical protein DPV78_012489 [Talaromyces pinophilus]|nr:hypothetical protein DPV78_012489 [Talaromyces pinophilus]
MPLPRQTQSKPDIPDTIVTGISTPRTTLQYSFFPSKLPVEPSLALQPPTYFFRVYRPPERDLQSPPDSTTSLRINQGG